MTIKIATGIDLEKITAETEKETKLKGKDFWPLVGFRSYERRCENAGRSHWTKTFGPIPIRLAHMRQSNETLLTFYNAIFLSGLGLATYYAVNYFIQR